MKDISYFIGGIAIAVGISFLLNPATKTQEPVEALGAFSDPFVSIQLAPSPTNGDCLTTDGTDNVWDTCGGVGGAIDGTGTSSQLAFFTDSNSLSSVATGTLTTTATGLELSATRGLVGGASILSITSGYVIPTTTRAALWDAKGNGTVTSVDMSVPTGLSIAGNPITTSGTLALSLTAGYVIPTTTRLTTLDSFAATPSTVITAGTGIDWSGNTLNGVYTAGDALTLTGEDFDFDGGATPAGALGGTWASPTVDDDGHNHTSASLSGIDISADTNLSADGTEIVLTGDALSLGTALTFTTGTSTTAFFSGLGTFTNSIINTLLTAASAVVTSVLQIPNGTGPTVDAAGEIAVDTTSDQLVFFGASKRVLTGYDYTTFTYATTTAWTGTTTLPLGPSYVAETWNGIQCFTDAGTLNVNVGDGTNFTNTNAASTTVGTTVFTTNNTFTAGEKRYFRAGTPASSPTTISCTISKSLTAD